MANTIRHKRGTSDPSASDFSATAELLVNTADGGLFTKKDDGSVVEIGAGGGGPSTGETYVKLKDDTASASNTGNNTYAGSSAGNAIASGAAENTLYGFNSGLVLSTADKCTIVGSDAGKAVTTANNTTVFGHDAGKAIVDGGANTCLGNASNQYLTTGAMNVAVGNSSGQVTTGSSNITIGQAVTGPATGSDNTLIGTSASSATDKNNNIVIGHDAAGTNNSNEITLGDTNITKFRVPGLNFSIKDSTATEDYVLTVDANGDAGWEAAAGGGGGGVNSDAQNNTWAGTDAGNSDNWGTAVENTTLYGHDAGAALTTADHGVFIGNLAGKVCTTGSYNSFIGASSGDAVTTGSSNVVAGFASGSNFTTGSQNVILGNNAAGGLRTGSDNIVIGKSADIEGSASDNVIIGRSAGVWGTPENDGNVAIGSHVAEDLSTGADNTIIGKHAASAGTNDLTTGSNNIILGHDAAASANNVSNEITLGDANITKFRVPGLNFVIKDSTATDNYVLTVDANGEAGWEAAAGGGGGLSSDAQRNTVGGSNAGDSFTGTDATDNTLIGYDAGTDITTADKNSLYGSYSGDSLTTGSYNTCVGMEAGAALTTSSYGVFVGYEAGKTYSTENQFGASALCVGGQAGKNSTGVKNTFVGTKCGQSSGSGQSNCYMGNETAGTRTGSFNIGIGAAAFPTGGDASNCVGLGFYVFSGLTSGSDNTAIGDNAGGLTTGSNCTLLGHDAAASSNTVSNEITLGDSNISSLRCQVQTISSLSDERDKTEIEDLSVGLDFVSQLKPVKFKWDSREGITKDGKTESGFIAQQLQTAQKENDADYLGLVYDNNPDRLEASYAKLIPVLVKAIQELKMEIETLKNNG